MDTDCPSTSSGERTPSAAQTAEEPIGQSKPETFAAHKEAIQSAIARLLSLKVELFRARARQWALMLAGGVVGLIVAVTLLVTATASLVRGVAGGMGEWAGGRLWLGQILAPVLLIGPLVFIVWIMSKLAAARRIRALKEKYPLDAKVNQSVPVREGTRDRDDGN